MAASKRGFAVLDIQNDDQELSMDLQFQDFGDTRTQPVGGAGGGGGGGGGGGKHEQTIHFTEFPDTAEEDTEQDTVPQNPKKRKSERATLPDTPLKASQVRLSAILPEWVKGEPALTQIAALRLNEKRFTSLAVKQLSLALPVPALTHLKRVRRIPKKEATRLNLNAEDAQSKDVTLIYLTLAEKLNVPPQEFRGESIASLDPGSASRVFARLEEMQIDTQYFTRDVYVCRAPVHAPKLRHVFDKVAIHWPCIFHEDGYLTRLASDAFFSPSEIEAIAKHMDRAIDAGRQANAAGNPSIGCVIVDGASGLVMSVAEDRRLSHPLQHAAMVAVDKVAWLQGGGVWTRGQPGNGRAPDVDMENSTSEPHTQIQTSTSEAQTQSKVPCDNPTNRQEVKGLTQTQTQTQTDDRAERERSPPSPPSQTKPPAQNSTDTPQQDTAQTSETESDHKHTHPHTDAQSTNATHSKDATPHTHTDRPTETDIPQTDPTDREGEPAHTNTHADTQGTNTTEGAGNKEKYKATSGEKVEKQVGKQGNSPYRQDQTAPTTTTTTTTSYICTGCDVFLTHEPCMMCAMALLHSRVRRVFYLLPNPRLGALVSRTKLHTLPGINHRYEVFGVTVE